MTDIHPFLALIGEVDDRLIDGAFDLSKNKEKNNINKLTKILLPIAACLTIAVVAIAYISELNGEKIKTTDFIVDNGILLCYMGDDTEIVIPENVIEISENAFSDNEYASKITKITTSKVKVNDGAFAKLSSLKCISVKNSALTDIDVDFVLSTDAEGLVSDGLGLQYLNDENGIISYAVSDLDGLELVFEDEEGTNPLSNGAVPASIVISSSGLIESDFQIGTELSDERIKDVKWDDITIDLITGTYNTILEENGIKYTYIWAIDQEQFAEFTKSVEKSKNFRNSPELFLEPITNNYSGVLEKIVIGNTLTMNRYIVDFDYGNEIRQFAIKFDFNLPYGWKASEQTDECTIYYRFDDRFDMDVPAMEFCAPIYVDADYVMDENVNSWTKRQTSVDSYRKFDNYQISTGTTEKGYPFVKYDLHTDEDYYAYYYIRLTDNFIVIVNCWEQEENSYNVENAINSMEVK